MIRLTLPSVRPLPLTHLTFSHLDPVAGIEIGSLKWYAWSEFLVAAVNELHDQGQEALGGLLLPDFTTYNARVLPGIFPSPLITVYHQTYSTLYVTREVSALTRELLATPFLYLPEGWVEKAWKLVLGGVTNVSLVTPHSPIFTRWNGMVVPQQDLQLI